MTPPALTFVTTCMGRLRFLRETLPLLAAQPAAACVVVDYGCPDHCGDWVQANLPQVKVVRWPAASTFHAAHARNLGAAAAGTLDVNSQNYAFGFLTLTPWSIRLSDRDADQVADAYEQQHYGTTTNQPVSDTDGDGFTLLQEYIAYTQPTNGQNFQRLEIGPVATSNGWKIFFPSSTGRLYRIDVATNLAPANWQPMVTNVPGTGSALEVGDTNPTVPRFFRSEVKMGDQ